MPLDMHIRLSDRIKAALTLYAADQDLKVTPAVRALLEEILEKKGYLAPRLKRPKR